MYPDPNVGPRKSGNPYMCHAQKSCFFGDGHPTFNRNPYNGYINPYYWVDDHPLLYGNNGSLDPATYKPYITWVFMGKLCPRIPRLNTINNHGYTVGVHQIVP